MIDKPPHRKQDTEIFLMNNWYKKATTSYIPTKFSTQTCKPELLENSKSVHFYRKHQSITEIINYGQTKPDYQNLIYK